MKLSEIIDFKKENSHFYMQEMIENYISFFKKCGYQEHQPVKISSRIDPTVHFIGSHISVLKPYFLNETLPFPGYVMTQPCVRTRNLKKYSDDLFCPAWGSMFHSLGTLAVPSQLEEVTAQTYSFLQNVWGIKPDDLKVRINTKDSDLVNVAENVFGSKMFETDKMVEKYYRHKLGIDGVWGRNFNLALRDGNSESFSDIGNVIILENKYKQLGIEIALGTSTIMKLNKGLSHLLDCHPLIGFEKLEDKALRIKVEDCIITSMALYDDGIEPSNTHITNRLMKKYMDILKVYLPKTNISFEKLACILNKYEFLEFGHTNPIFSKKMLDYIFKQEKNNNHIAIHKTPKDIILNQEHQKIK